MFTLQVTLGDIIGYIFIITATAITVSTVVKVNFSSHHNTEKKQIKEVKQSFSTVGRDQIGGDKR